MNRASFVVALKDERVRPKSTGGSKRTRSGVWLPATACTLSEGLSRPPLNYLGNLGRTCQSQIRTLANARAETFRKKSRQTRKVSIYFWPQSEVGARIASLLNELVSLL